jgi:hypothetical protein
MAAITIPAPASEEEQVSAIILKACIGASVRLTAKDMTSKNA